MSTGAAARFDVAWVLRSWRSDDLEGVAPVLLPLRTSRLRITLRDVSSAVARVIDIPATSTSAELHDLLQAALGWNDSHLHQFVAGGRNYGVAGPEWGEELYEVEAVMRLRDLRARFVYRYDLGDCWEHDVELLGSGDDRPWTDTTATVKLARMSSNPSGSNHLRSRRMTSTSSAAARVGASTLLTSRSSPTWRSISSRTLAGTSNRSRGPGGQGALLAG
jgi:hypothetical protein